jgi:hypothetical protein
MRESAYVIILIAPILLLYPPVYLSMYLACLMKNVHAVTFTLRYTFTWDVYIYIYMYVCIFACIRGYSHVCCFRRIVED